MIPREIESLLDAQKGETDRTDTSQVERALSDLGIERDTQFGQFFFRHKVGGILSPVRSDTLLDIESIVDATEFGRETYEIRDEYVCLTSGEGEGFYLYDKLAGCVFDVDVKDLDSLEAGEMDPRWNDFFDFMYWYLGGSGTLS